MPRTRGFYAQDFTSNLFCNHLPCEGKVYSYSFQAIDTRVYIYICLLIHQHHPRFSRGWKVKCFLLDNSCDLKCKKKYVSRMLYGSGEMLGQFLSLSF